MQKQETKTTAIGPKKMVGLVTSSKMSKTIVVAVTGVKKHPKYPKQFQVRKKYKVHDERGQFKEGDRVQFIACRPISKDKCWRVIYPQ